MDEHRDTGDTPVGGSDWEAQVRERFGVEPTKEAMHEEIHRRGWTGVAAVNLDQPWGTFTLGVPGIAEMTTTGATLEEAMGRALLHVPPDAWDVAPPDEANIADDPSLGDAINEIWSSGL